MYIKTTKSSNGNLRLLLNEINRTTHRKNTKKEV